MDTLQAALYSRIDNFNLDVDGIQLPFSKRLATENKWSELFALRAIDEYKKFTFLAMVAGHPVTPSLQVDAVWHLHLTYSQSYWQEFCPNILGRSLHHEPTQGGADEAEKFRVWYGNTLTSYETWFNEKPPSDIWPDVNERFSRQATLNDIFKKVSRYIIVLLAGFLWGVNTLIGYESKRAVAAIILILIVFNIIPKKSKSNSDIDFDGGDGDSGCGGGCGGD